MIWIYVFRKLNQDQVWDILRWTFQLDFMRFWNNMFGVTRTLQLHIKRDKQKTMVAVSLTKIMMIVLVPITTNLAVFTSLIVARRGFGLLLGVD